MSGVITGSKEHKEKLRKQFWDKEEQHGADCHVATSPRRDVSTLRREDVATSPRCDVSTSRRLHVATSARESACHHLMYERLGN